MYCPNCGAEIGAKGKFCPHCGEQLGVGQSAQAAERRRETADRQTAPEGERVTPNIVRGVDGKLRWTYEISLLKNPIFFLLVWKIFFFIIIGIFAFIMLIDVFGGDMNTERFLNNLKIMGFILLGATVLTVLGYLLYAAIMGGKYIALFEMDENGVNHKQLPAQAKKAKRIGQLTVLAGLLSGKPGTVGIGLTSQRTEMYSEFARVRKVRSYPRRHMIKVNERFGHNQVYAADEDFAFVEKFIISHVPADSVK